ncbi:hypothetical protein ACXIZN_04340 [Amycolatopsis sp. TRM77291]
MKVQENHPRPEVSNDDNRLQQLDAPPFEAPDAVLADQIASQPIAGS